MEEQKRIAKCDKCGEVTPVTYKTDEIHDNIEHVYAECQECGAKITVFYTNAEIRGLLMQQEALTKDIDKKQSQYKVKKRNENAKKLRKLMAELMAKEAVAN